MRSLSLLIGIVLLFQSCQNEGYIPKPTGFARIDFPVHSYQRMESSEYPFEFEFGDLSNVVAVNAPDDKSKWFNIEYPSQKAKLHLTYSMISKEDVAKYIEDTRQLAVKHLVKADDFEESLVLDTAENVYGVIYDFQGNSASNLQFYLTDSTNHFLRGALYFEVVPNADSIAPAEKYIEEEVMHLVNTFRWKE